MQSASGSLLSFYNKPHAQEMHKAYSLICYTPFYFQKTAYRNGDRAELCEVEATFSEPYKQCSTVIPHVPLKDTDNRGKQRKHFNATTLGKMVPVTPKYIFHGIKRFKFKQKVRFILNETVLVMCCHIYYWPIIVSDMIILYDPVNR